VSLLIARRPASRAALAAPVARWLLPLFTLFVAACAGPAVHPLAAPREQAASGDFDLVARVSVSQGEARHSGRLYWRRQSGDDELALVSPFGQTVAEISVNRERARLVAADGSVHEAADASALTEAVLGYPLPVARLAGWLQAQPGTAAVVAGRDERGRPTLLLDAGWEIAYDYADDAAAGTAPLRIVARRVGGLEVRLRIDEWSGPPNGPPNGPPHPGARGVSGVNGVSE